MSRSWDTVSYKEEEYEEDETSCPLLLSAALLLGAAPVQAAGALTRGEAAHEQTPSTAEAKIKALYDCVMDTDGREKAGVAPIQKYLDAIENAATLNELAAADVTMQQELGLSTLLGFGLTTDLADPSRKTTAFSLIGAGMGKDFYANGTDAQKAAYSTYLTTLLTLSGLSGDEAARRVALAYVDEYFSAAAKADVEEMIGEFISIYKERILAQDWMSAETKAKAIRKLDNMGVKVGYPDSWDTYLDRVEIQSPEQGGSFFSNVIAIQRAAKAETLAHQNDAPDKREWIMTPYTVNACYDPTANDITFPAAILQAPLYDVNASREEDLGGIGYIIAHEITHAFDNNGAKFDENGSAADWWTAEDYAAFQQKCQAVADRYDGQGAYPGVACSGVLTVSENVADLGSARCIVAAAKKLDDPDFDKLFRAVANTWASTTTRQMREYLAVTDVHAPDKLRCNRVLQTLPEFYETYGIQPGDGMWTDPASRVSVW